MAVSNFSPPRGSRAGDAVWFYQHDQRQSAMVPDWIPKQRKMSHRAWALSTSWDALMPVLGKGWAFQLSPEYDRRGCNLIYVKGAWFGGFKERRFGGALDNSKKAPPSSPPMPCGPSGGTQQAESIGQVILPALQQAGQGSRPPFEMMRSVCLRSGMYAVTASDRWGPDK